MARCPKCKHHFRTLEDEEGMHDCPRCGYDGYGYHCPFCNQPSRRPVMDGCMDCLAERIDADRESEREAKESE